HTVSDKPPENPLRRLVSSPNLRTLPKGSRFRTESPFREITRHPADLLRSEMRINCSCMAQTVVIPHFRLEGLLMRRRSRLTARPLVSASMCLGLAALFSCGAPSSPALSAAGPAAVPAAADWALSFPTEGETPVGNATVEDLAQYG